MKINILVTGIGGGGVGRQIIKALQLSGLDYVLFGSDITPVSYGRQDVDSFTLFPNAHDANYIGTVLRFCIEKEIQVLFPGSEHELVTLSKCLDLFETNGIYVPINENELISLCADKFRCNNFLMENGFNCPDSFLIRSFEDLNKIDFFPAVLKPVSGSGGSSNVLIAQNRGELETFTQYLLLNKVDVIAQEYIGNYENEFTVGVLHSNDGKLINSIVLKRNISGGLGFNLGVNNRTCKAELGDRLVISSGISQGEFVERSFVNDVCEEIASKLNSKSTINIQGRIHKGKFYVFEINPRFSGTTSSRALVRYNEPEILINKKILGMEVTEKFVYDKGSVYRGLQERLIKN
jgi:carbamoyl-phosphate synthase large subunit